MDVDREPVKWDVGLDSDDDSDTVLLPVANIGPAVWSISVEAGADSLRLVGAEPALSSIEVVAVGVLL